MTVIRRQDYAPVQLVTPAVAPADSSGYARAVERVGDKIAGLGAQIAEVKHQTAMTEAQTFLTRRLGELRLAADQNPDPDQAWADFEAGQATAFQDAQERFGTRGRSADVKLLADQLAIAPRLNVQAGVARKQIERGVAASNNLMDALETGASLASGPEYEDFKARLDDHLVQQVQAGVRDPVDAGQQRAQRRRQMDFDRAHREILAEPQKAFETLLRPDYLPDLAPKDRPGLQQAAETRFIQVLRLRNDEEEQKQKRAARDLKSSQDALGVELWQRLSRSNLTVDEIVDLPDDALTAEARVSLIRASSQNMALADDLLTRNALERLVYAGGDATSEIDTAVLGGRITKETATALRAKNQELQAAGGPNRVKRPVDMWRNWLEDISGQKNFLSQFDQGRAARNAEMMVGYDSATRHNPNMGEAELEKLARSLYERWGRGVRSDDLSALPLPSANVMEGMSLYDLDVPEMVRRNEAMKLDNPAVYNDNRKKIAALMKAKERLERDNAGIQPKR